MNNPGSFHKKRSESKEDSQPNQSLYKEEKKTNNTNALEPELHLVQCCLKDLTIYEG